MRRPFLDISLNDHMKLLFNIDLSLDRIYIHEGVVSSFELHCYQTSRKDATASCIEGQENAERANSIGGLK